VRQFTIDIHFLPMSLRDPWSDASRSRVSDRWAEPAAGWNRALTDALISAAAIGSEHLVLDLAAGSGDPSLEIVQRFPSATVVALDRSFAGLQLAHRNSEQLGVASRIDFVQSDVHAIPLESGRVDRITCRFGVMFFEELGSALSEMLRVLKPGGQVALLAWGAFKQPFFEATIGAVLRLVPGAALPEASHAMYRFASPGSLATALRKAKFCNVQEREITLPRIWAGSTEQLWEYQQDVSTLYHPLFDSIPETVRPRVDKEVVAGLSRFRNHDLLTIPVQVVLATATRIAD
jgi:ubiquinone/menaquinone biosynthesis C-methylase UbiE